MDGKNNKEEETREVADMYHFSWNFLQLGGDMLWFKWCLRSKSFSIFSIFVTTLRPCDFEVKDTVDSKENKEEKTREVPDMRL